jgi:hypothetical protein
MKTYEDGVEVMRARVQELIQDMLANAACSSDATLALNELAGNVQIAKITEKSNRTA